MLVWQVGSRSGGVTAVFSVFKTPALLALIPALAFQYYWMLEVPIFLSRLTGLLGAGNDPCYAYYTWGANGRDS